MLKDKNWKKKRSKLYKTIDNLNLNVSVMELWEIYLKRYFVTMDLGSFCSCLKKGLIKI